MTRDRWREIDTELESFGLEVDARALLDRMGVDVRAIDVDAELAKLADGRAVVLAPRRVPAVPAAAAPAARPAVEEAASDLDIEIDAPATGPIDASAADLASDDASAPDLASDDASEPDLVPPHALLIDEAQAASEAAEAPPSDDAPKAAASEASVDVDLDENTPTDEVDASAAHAPAIELAPVRIESIAPPGMSAVPISFEAARVALPEHPEGSGVIELEVDDLRSNPLPAVLSLDATPAAAPVSSTESALDALLDSSLDAAEGAEAIAVEASASVRLSLDDADDVVASPLASDIAADVSEPSLAIPLVSEKPVLLDRPSQRPGSQRPESQRPGSQRPAPLPSAAGGLPLEALDSDLPPPDEVALQLDDDAGEPIPLVRASTIPPRDLGADIAEEVTYVSRPPPSIPPEASQPSLDDELDALLGVGEPEPPRSEEAPLPLDSEHPLFGDEPDEPTEVALRAIMQEVQRPAPDEELAIDIDDDALVVEDLDDEPAPPPPSRSMAPPPPPGASQRPPPPPPGFLSRILNRKS